MGYNYEYMEDTIRVAEMTPNLFLESSLTESALALFDNFFNTITNSDARKLLFGSDTPESEMGIELDKLRSLELSEGDMNKILGENAWRLLGEG
jgi:predicted TIM-barrel fold metal-dependent hydrolase